MSTTGRGASRSRNGTDQRPQARRTQMRHTLTDGPMTVGAWQRRPRRAGPHAQPSTRPRVVIVGAGFGGLECARKLNRAAVDVLLLDKGGYHLFTPLLYQVATALLNPSEIAYPLRAVFRKSPNVRALTTTATGIDLRRRVVRASP